MSTADALAVVTAIGAPVPASVAAAEAASGLLQFAL